MNEIQNRLSSFFGKSLGNNGVGGFALADRAPLVDVIEDKKEYVIKAELPDVTKEAVKVHVENGMPAIIGERQFEKEKGGKKYHRVERSYGSFERIPPIETTAIACRTCGYLALLLSLNAVLLTGKTYAQGVPSFSYSFGDAITGDNEFTTGGYRRWDVDPGSDNYYQDVYERPMNQSFGYNAGRYSTNSDYFGNLDIVRGQFGFDSTYAYFATDMFSTTLEYASGGSADEGLKYHYRIRVSLDSSGAGGYLFSTDTPYDFGTNWHTEKNFVYRDTNGDLAVDGNGYDLPIVSDGRLSGTEVFWTRLRPGDASVVEFAINLESFGFTASQLANLPYLVFEANKGLLDPQNYLWNKEYTPSEAGSPNGGPGGLSEFGTQGLGNIYELDTLRAGAIPEPSSALLFCMGSIGLFYRRRNRSSQGV